MVCRFRTWLLLTCVGAAVEVYLSVHAPSFFQGDHQSARLPKPGDGGATNSMC